MARTEARIKTEIWHNDKFLARPILAQWVYFVALSQPDLSFCGVVSYTAKRWSLLAPKLTAIAIRKAVSELQEHGFVFVDERTEELWVRTFMKHDGVLKSPNLTIAMSREFINIHSATIRGLLIEGLGEGFLQGLDEPIHNGLREEFRQGFLERFPNGSRVRSAEPPPPASTSTPSQPAKGSSSNGNGHGAPDPKADDVARISPLGDALHAGLKAKGCKASAAQCEGTVREILTWAASDVVSQELGKLIGYEKRIASPQYFRSMVEHTMRDAGQPVPPRPA